MTPFAVLLASCLAAGSPQADPVEALRAALTFHAAFDAAADADFGSGDRRIHTSKTGKITDGVPGLETPGVSLAPDLGRFGGALRFEKKQQAMVFYRAERNLPYSKEDWSGTVSLWLRLNPEEDLEPGYCDPIQITDKAWDQAAFFVDFTKDERPRHFRLGAFADREVWNPRGLDWDTIPEAERPFATVKKHPFGRYHWTHVVFTFERFNTSGKDPVASLYLDGVLEGRIEGRPQRFTWDPDKAAILIGLSYIGLMDDLAVFHRALSAEEVRRLHGLPHGVRGLHAAEAKREGSGLRTELIFPLRSEHNHAPGIVECPSGDLFVSWYRGSGERSADDVAVWGARKREGSDSWSDAFLLADVPGFPDCNTAMHVDAEKRLWLFWPTIIANSWESCLTNYRVSSDYDREGAPRWDWQGVIFLRPLDFQSEMEKGLEARLALSGGARPPEGSAERLKTLIADKLHSRLGWQPRCKPTVLPSGRMLLPLYSDTYSVSVMAMTDDEGKTWSASKPLAGFGSIQPAVLRRSDGTLVAYMRENGPLDRVRVAESKDDGVSWGPVGVTELPNPGSGLDAVRLESGTWLLVYNDTTRGRSSLAVSLSDDEGRSWKWTRHLERHESGSYHYPAVIQGRDGTVHAVYSYFVAGGKSMKHAAFDEAWVRSGDER